MHNEPQFLTVRELATFLRVHQSTIYRMLREHRLPAFRIGWDWRFSRADIIEWLRAGTISPETLPGKRPPVKAGGA
jgi:excisionase family DNA binding protein